MSAWQKEQPLLNSSCQGVPLGGYLNSQNSNSWSYIVRWFPFFPWPNFILLLRYKNMPQERSLQKRVLVPRHLVGRRESPFQFWRPRKQQNPRVQVKAQGRSQETKKRWRRRETLSWGKKTQDRRPKSQRPSSSLQLISLQGKLPTPPNNGPKSQKCSSQPKVSDWTGRKHQSCLESFWENTRSYHSFLWEWGLNLNVFKTPTSYSNVCSCV